MQRNLCLVLVAICAVGLVSAHLRGEEATPPKWQPKSLLVSESLSKNANLPIVSVEVDGKKCRFIVATTELITMVDRQLCTNLKPFRLKKIETPTQLQDMVEAPEIKLGSFKAGLAFVEPINFKHASVDNGEQIHGILAMDVLRELVLQIDPDNDVLQIASPNPADVPPGVHFPLYLDAEFVPRMSCTIVPGQATNFAIATADYSNGSINKASADYLAKNGVAIKRNQIVFANSAATKKLDAVSIPRIDCGNAKLRELEFTIKEDNCLGMFSLLRFNISFDFKNRRVFCLPSLLNSCADRNDQLGLVFDSVHQIYSGRPFLSVSRVDKGLAADAGLVSGDKIVAVNGFNVESQFGKAYQSLYAPSLSATIIELERSDRKLSLKLLSER